MSEKVIKRTKSKKLVEIDELDEVLEVSTSKLSEINIVNEDKNDNDDKQSSIKELTFEDLKKVIDENEYVKNCKSNEKPDINSLSFLIHNRNLSQSDKIKLGQGMEKVLKDIIEKNTELINIKEKNAKGEKERDHLFEDNKNKIIYYAELKSNINLDTEKSKSTSEKCLKILDELQIQYPDYKIKMFLVNLRFLEKKDVDKVVLNKYTNIKNNLCGINEYLSNLGVKFNFKDEKNYAEFLNYLVDKMYKKEIKK